ncbi:MAG: NADH:ubiquinone reductase (Na(+)-transporting) subunit C [Bacteroidales bacterium]|jgi:Na+-transporting NADH:ubiquinone oxidoreductase subunit C|nr:NADH:ubiquinone reductase (Na(+)-transporting) subunit C [Bacteroidales bacterium]MCK9447506.1 NADH:ubiquinone reductase (Na(+)-transporting) subunit C [Bacteroidales bacterium]MDD3700620.1 NADH:ubiquinone reductase (Na(+)-transporting) subunit C [Bacteroidales bacterium]MDY0368257.1 NADH:ubiquinone reductase (Na(+)-transporting) subunit C [Bacteroidales bacterium]
MYSNAYILRYAAIMVILVAAILSSAAMLLKPLQDRNEAVDKMQSILIAAGFENVNSSNAIEMFNDNVTQMIVIDQDGNLIDEYTDDAKENSMAFKLNLKEELYNKSLNKPYKLPLYIAERNDKHIYIIPLHGVGLWGALWGNIALKDDFITVVGVTFGHKSETPGLGAEIETPIFEDQFPGKVIFDETGKFTSIQVVKGGVASLPADLQKHKVDAISGGTITSNGVNDMLQNVLESYVTYFKSQE